MPCSEMMLNNVSLCRDSAAAYGIFAKCKRLPFFYMMNIALTVACEFVGV